MIFTTKKEVSIEGIRVREKVTANNHFRYALDYPMGKEATANNKWFEVVDYKERWSARYSLTDPLSVSIPNRILFISKGDSITAIAKYGKFIFKMDVECLEEEEKAFYTKSETEKLKDRLKEATAFFIEEDEIKKMTPKQKIEIENVAMATRDFLIDYWVDIPGFTDGPERDSSVTELMECMKM